MKSKIANCIFYTCPSDTIKHSLEVSKAGSTRLTLNKSIVQLSKFICWNYNPALSWLWIFLFDPKVAINTFFNFVMAAELLKPVYRFGRPKNRAVFYPKVSFYQTDNKVISFVWMLSKAGHLKRLPLS